MNQQTVVWAILAIGLSIYAATLNKTIADQKQIIVECSSSIEQANKNINQIEGQIEGMEAMGNTTLFPVSYLEQNLTKEDTVANPCGLDRFIVKK